ERIIWRPNAISPEEWDKMTREEQIQWYRDEATRAPKAPPPHPLVWQQHYLEGRISEGELWSDVFQHLTENNVEEFITGCCPKVLDILSRKAEEMPGDIDEYGWTQYVIARMILYAPWVAPEEAAASEARWRRRIREGVK